MMRTIRSSLFVIAALWFGICEAFGQSRQIVPGDVGIQVPFGAVGDVLVAGPGTSQIQDGGTASNLGITSTGTPTTRSLAARFADELNVKDFGAAGDTLTWADGTISSGSTAFSSTSATFASTDCNASHGAGCTGTVDKQIAIDQAGSAGAPLVTTIVGFANSHNVTLAAAASVSVPYIFIYATTTVAAGTGYVPGDTITDGNVVMTVYETKVVSATVASGGSGGSTNTAATSGTCTVTGTTGVSEGNFFQASVTITAGVVTAVSSISRSAAYTTNPTAIATEPVTGCSSLAGAALNVVMGVNIAFPTVNHGSYSVAPPSPLCVSPACTTSGVGTGATFTPTTITGGAFAYGTDDTSAISTAFTTSNTANQTTSSHKCIRFPAGDYWISSSTPLWKSNGCIVGAGLNHTFLRASPSLTGPLIQYSEAWAASGTPSPNGGGMYMTTNRRTGPVILDLSLVADRNSHNTQHAIMFWDRSDEILIENVNLAGFNGSCIVTGQTNATSQAYIRESYFSHIRAWYCGNSTWPAILLDSFNNTAGDATNQVKMDSVEVFAQFGHGIMIRNSGSVSAVRTIQMTRIRVEALYPYPYNIAADNLVIGDSSAAGQTDTLSCHQCELIVLYPNQYALRLDANGSALAPYFFDFDGIVGNAGVGNGLYLHYGRNNSFHFYGVNTIGWNVITTGNTGGANNITSPGGTESLFTYNIASGSPLTHYPVISGMVGAQATSPTMSTTVADNTAQGGNTLGNGAVNLSVNHGNAYQVATGSNSVVIGGINAQANGTGAVAIGGNNNGVNGQYSFVGAGFHVTDRGWYGAVCQSSGTLTDFAGDANYCTQILRCQLTSTSACRGTADNAAAGSANVVNIPNNAAYTVTLDCAAFDRTTVTKNMSWQAITYFLTRGANAASTALLGTASPAATFSNGTVTGAALSLTADTTNGGLNASFTPPTGNTDTWDFTCRAGTHQVQ